MQSVTLQAFKRSIMLERFLSQTTFTSQEDFVKHFHVKVPENFNFGYDVVDAWAAEAPNKIALFFLELISKLCSPIGKVVSGREIKHAD